MDIVYSSTELLNIKPLTVVNGNTYYEIEVKDKECPCKHKFMCTLQSTKFIAMMHADNLHIFNLMQYQDGIFPDDFRRYIDENRVKILNLSGSFQIDAFNRENPHNLAIIIPDSPPQCPAALSHTMHTRHTVPRSKNVGSNCSNSIHSSCRMEDAFNIW
jgi:hypothetical protein